MKSEIEITEIVKRHKGKHLQFGNVQTWMDAGNEEGIELISGKTKSFWYRNNERIYGEPTSDAWQKCIAEVIEQKPEQLPATTAQLPFSDAALLPDFLTPALMSKWAQMTTTDRVLMFQQTPKDKIKYVKVGKDDKGQDVTAPYVEGNYMFREANAAFLFDWHLSDVVITVCPTSVGVTSKLNAWFSDHNRYLSRPATGYQELNKKVDTELAKKGATTDAIKKGLSLFGFNSDVYSGEV